jgi:hypothetical protein
MKLTPVQQRTIRQAEKLGGLTVTAEEYDDKYCYQTQVVVRPANGTGGYLLVTATTSKYTSNPRATNSAGVTYDSIGYPSKRPLRHIPFILQVLAGK